MKNYDSIKELIITEGNLADIAQKRSRKTFK